MKFIQTALVAFAVVISPPAMAQLFKLRLGSVLPPTDPLQIAAEGFKKAVAERSNGRLVIDLYPNSQIGDSQVMMDAAASGANAATFIEASRVAGIVPEFNVLIAPYAFESAAELARFSETELFAKWNKALKEKSGLTFLSFNWYQGARHVLTKKAVLKPADLTGVKLRTINQPLWMQTIKAMGAIPTPMPWAEVSSAIEAGLITGAEAQPSAIWGAKLHEVVDHIALTGHIHLMSGLIVSDQWLQSLPPELRAILIEEAKRWGASATRANVEGAAKILNDVRKAGVKVSEVDTTPFREAVKPVWESMKLTVLVNDVRRSLGKK